MSVAEWALNKQFKERMMDEIYGKPVSQEIKNKCIIIDLEGTLSDDYHRRHFLEQKNYDKYNELFANDPVNVPFLNILTNQSILHGEDIKVIMVTAKSDIWKDQVEMWLDHYDLTKIISSTYYRAKLDSRSSVLVKRDILHAIQEEYEVIKAFDNRQDICDMFESEGVPAINVGCTRTQKASDILLRLSQLHQEKDKEYGSSYKGFGNIMNEFFPDGLTLKSSSDFSRYAILNIMVSKVDRYCKNFTIGGHPDSLDDISVYSAMLREVDQESE